MRVLIILFVILCVVNADYWSTRSEFIKNEKSLAVGSRIKLNEKEQILNKFLMEAKHRELKFGFNNPGSFPPAQHFFKAKHTIDKSIVFNIIRKMPKGGVLHVHDTGMSSVDYVVNNITYRDHLYACKNQENLKLLFAASPPADKCWQSMKTLRDEAENEDEFNEWLKTYLSLMTVHPENVYTDINVAWKKFANIFEVQFPMLTYRPVFLDYFYNALEEFYKDNVNYIEVRGVIPSLYELNGTIYDSVQVAGMLRNVAKEFMANYPDFVAIKYIYAPGRNCDNNTMSTYIENMKSMRKLYPDFIVGFDLVGQEDMGKPLTSFVAQLQELDNQVKFYFHAGETNWMGMPTDLNLIDAVLLNTTRIGHGYAITKHPYVLKEVKRRGIGIEINPISNQVLKLVNDLRNHPASLLLALDFPVVISSDDPGLWNAAPLSHDFYEVFMGIAGKNDNLRMLKQLIINSFEYSSLSHEDKRIAIDKWTEKWNHFVDIMIENK